MTAIFMQVAFWPRLPRVTIAALTFELSPWPTVTLRELWCLRGESREVGFEHRIEQIRPLDAGSAEDLTDTSPRKLAVTNVVRRHARHRAEVEPVTFVTGSVEQIENITCGAVRNRQARDNSFSTLAHWRSNAFV
jgi:hypothetical protein